MSPRLVMCTIAVCAASCAAFVYGLALLGLPVLLALVAVYIVAIVSMLLMQQRARQSTDGLLAREHGGRRYRDSSAEPMPAVWHASSATSRVRPGRLFHRF